MFHISKVSRPLCLKYFCTASSQSQFLNLPCKKNTTSNGVSFISLEPTCPTTAKVAYVFAAGSRFEDYNSRGFNHVLRRALGLSSGELTHVMVSRHIQQMGAKMSCIGTRELLIYSVECLPSLIPNVTELLNDVIMEQNFYQWELLDHVKPLLDTDIQHLYRKDFDTLCSELIHEASYGDGLGNSLFANPFETGWFETHQLQEFVKQNFTVNKTHMVGVCVPDNILSEAAENLKVNPFVSFAVPKPKFRGGSLRHKVPIDSARVAVAWEGPGFNDTKNCLAATILCYCLDPGMQSLIRKSSPDVYGSQILKNCDVAKGLLNVYSDSSLLGFYIVGDRTAAGEGTKEMYKHYSAVSKNGVKSEDFEIAKNLLKSKLLMKSTDQDDVLEHIASQAAGSIDIMNIDEMIKMVESISLGDVNKIVKDIGSKPKSMAAVGDLAEVPFMDDLK